MNRITIASAAVLAVAALALSGCAVQGEPVANADSSSAPTKAPDPAPATVTPDKGDPANRVLAFGETWSFDDGVTMAVGAPQPMTPGQYAFGADFPNNVAITFTIVNGSAAPITLSAYTRVTSGQQNASQVFDSDNPALTQGQPGMATVLAGQTYTWTEGWSLADPATITLTSAPNYEYMDVVWTTAP